MQKKKDYKVPALEKGLEILETLSAASVPMSLTELSLALGRGPSELYRMIGFLEERGYIIREYSGNYHLSLKLYELAHTHSPVEQMIRAATIPMRELAVRIGESCHLSVLQGQDILVLHQQFSPQKYRFSVEVGATFDALSTTSGQLLIAHLPEEEREYFLRNHADFSSSDREEQEELRKRLSVIAANGYCFSDKDGHLGIRDTAVMVGNPRVSLSAALAVPSLIISKNQRFDESILEELRECSRRICAAMGVESIV